MLGQGPGGPAVSRDTVTRRADRLTDRRAERQAGRETDGEWAPLQCLLGVLSRGENQTIGSRS